MSIRESPVVKYLCGCRLFERLAKINRWLAPLAAIFGAAAWFQPSVVGSDLWWHLAAGREVWQTLRLPTADHFSFTFDGRPWMHLEWLWGVGYWLAFEVDPELVAWLNLGLLVAIFSVAFVVARCHCGSSFGAGCALWAAAATAHWFLDIRPHELTLLFLGIVLLTRNKTWAPWLWPVLMVLWCNLHGGFVFGFGVIGLFALVETIRVSLAVKRVSINPRLLAGVALTGLGLLCNPWGFRILEYPLAYLDSSSPFRQIIEWWPPGASLDPRGFAGRFAWLLVAAAAGAVIELRSRPRDLFLVALAGVTCAMALTSRRFIPLFAIASLPMVARLFTDLRDRAAKRLPKEFVGRVILGAPLAALLVAASLWRDVRLAPRLLERWTETQIYPSAALRYLQVLDPGPRLLNHYNWGGFVMLHAPEFKVMIDGRANTLYDEKTYVDYVVLSSGQGELSSLLAQYPVDSALLPAGSGQLAEALASARYNWRVVYADQTAIVLLPPNSERLARPLPRPDDFLSDEPDWLLMRGITAAEVGRREEGRALIEAAIAREPLLIRGYGLLARFAAQEQNPDGIAAAIERGIAIEPRWTQSLRLQEARAYEEIGDLERSLVALERAIPRGPFVRPEGILKHLAELRQKRDSPR